MQIDHFQLGDFIDVVNARFSPSQPDTIFRCCEAMSRLTSSYAIQQFISAQVNMARHDPDFVGDWAANEICVHRTGSWRLSVVLLDSIRRYIHAVPELAVYIPLKGPLSADRYRLPDNYRNEVFDPSVKLEPAGSVSVEVGAPLQLETDHYAYDFRNIEPVPVIVLTTAPLKPLEWLFSKSTLQAWQANDADLSSTQLRVAAYVLGKIAHQSSVNPLKNLACHSHHAVRWAAIQNLGRLNRSEALIKIREATQDPHPHVRRAAQKTLEQIEKRADR